MLIRAGFYFGTAAGLLGDHSYAEKYLGHAELLTPEVCMVLFAEVQARLVAGGHIAPDEDPFDEIGITFKEP